MRSAGPASCHLRGAKPHPLWDHPISAKGEAEAIKVSEPPSRGNPVGEICDY